MKKYTKLMSKLYSDETPVEVTDEVMTKIEEAKEVGSSETDDHTFVAEGDSVVITDKNDPEDVTVATETEDGVIDLEAKVFSDGTEAPVDPELNNPKPKMDPAKVEDPAPADPVDTKETADAVKEIEQVAKTFCNNGDICTYNGSEVTVTDSTIAEDGTIEVMDSEGNTMRAMMDECLFNTEKSMSTDFIDRSLNQGMDEPMIKPDEVKAEDAENGKKVFSATSKPGSDIDRLFFAHNQ